MTSAAQRPLGLAKRADLRWRRERGGDRGVTVKDPVAMRYVRLSEEEFAILDMLEASLSLEDLRTRFERRFAPRKLSASRLHAFLSQLHRDQLVVSGNAGQGRVLAERGRRRQRQSRRERWLNPLAIRFRGVDPEPFWPWLDPAARLAFSPGGCLAGFAVLLAAVVLLAGQARELEAQLPAVGELLTADSLWWTAVAIALAKVLHELGHAAVCRRFGGECHEIGLMLLVFTPCLYCNVSDSWMFASKWRRMAVAAAGIYVELVLAAAGLFVWWLTQPGGLHSLGLRLAMVCSLNTVLFNGNPLLKYDGYYVLSDWTETPNLWSRSRRVVAARLRRWLTGIRSPQDRSETPRQAAWLAAYGVLSIAYRWLVLAMILLLVYSYLKAQRLESLGGLLTAALLAAAAARPLNEARRFLAAPESRRALRRGRARMTVLLLAAAAVGLWWLPAPGGVRAPIRIDLDDAAFVRVRVAGGIVDGLAYGRAVEEGEQVAALKNEDLQRRVAELAGECAQLRAKLSQLETRRLNDALAANEVPATRQLLAGREAELRQLREDLQNLVLRAPIAGTIFRPPQPAAPEEDLGELPELRGFPLDLEHRGAYLEVDSVLCRIGDPRRLIAVAFVDQSEVEYVASGQSARVQVAAYPGRILRGVVTEIAEVESRRSSATAEEQTPAAAAPDPQAPPVYRVAIALEPGEHSLPLGLEGDAKIQVRWRTVGERLQRWIQSTFRFRM